MMFLASWKSGFGIVLRMDQSGSENMINELVIP